ALAIVLGFGGSATAFAFAGVQAFTGVFFFLALGCLLAGVGLGGGLIAAGVLCHSGTGSTSDKACQRRTHQESTHGFRHREYSFLFFIRLARAFGLHLYNNKKRPRGLSAMPYSVYTARFLPLVHASSAYQHHLGDGYGAAN